MKKLSTFLKTLLIVALPIVGSNVAWGDVTPVTQDYSGEDPTADWTSKNTERYTVSVTKGVLYVNPVSNGQNGATITGTTVNGKVPQGSDFASSDDFTLIFDLQLTGGNDNTSSFYIYDSENKDATPILALTAPYSNGTVWTINNNSNIRVNLSKSTWYTFKLSKSGSYLYLTITPTGESNPVFAQQTIQVNSSKGGLGKMVFNTGRYYSYMAIDNVVLRDLENSDIPTNAKTYSIKAKAGDIVIKTISNSGAAAQGSSIRISCLNWAISHSGKWYKLNDTNVSNYTKTFTKGANDNEEFVVNYILDESIAYYTEAEALSGWYNQEQKKDYSSNGLSRFLGDKKLSVTTNFSVAAGKYDLCAIVFLRSSGSLSEETISEVNSDSEVEVLGTIGGSGGSTTTASELTLPNLTLGEGSDIKISRVSGNSQTCFDYIYLKKPAVTYTIKYMCDDVEIQDEDDTRTAIWGTHISLTDEDKADITYNGHIYRYTYDDTSTQAIASDGSTVITVNFELLGEVTTVSYTLNVGTEADTSIKSSTSTSDDNNVTDIDIDQTYATGNGNGESGRTTKLPIATGANGEIYDNPSNYVLFKYTIADGKKFIPSNIVIKVANVGSASDNNIKYKATLSDGENTIYGTHIGTKNDGTIETFIVSNNEYTSFTGNVTLTLWAWTISDKDNGGSAFRMGSPLTITGAMTDMTNLEIAIATCKRCENSADFTAALDAESFSSAEEVYAFYSEWHIAQAEASASTDYSKAIVNRSFEYHTTAGWTIYGDANSSAPTDADKYGEVRYGVDWSQYYTGWNGRNVSQNIATLPAGKYRLTAKVYSWTNNGAPVRLFGNETLSTAEDGLDHTPTLDFIVSGNEESIKIGIGGIGNDNNTDNTWGTWGYNVTNFTLTLVARPVSNIATSFTNGGTLEAEKWYYYDISTANSYSIVANLEDIVYTITGTTLEDDVNDSFTNIQDLTATRYYFKSSSEQTLTFTEKGNTSYRVNSSSTMSDGHTVASVYGITMTYHGTWTWDSNRNGTAKADEVPTEFDNNAPTSGNYWEFKPTVDGLISITAAYYTTQTYSLVDVSTGENLQYINMTGSHVYNTAKPYGILKAGKTYKLYKANGVGNGYQINGFTFDTSVSSYNTYNVASTDIISCGTKITKVPGISMTFGGEEGDSWAWLANDRPGFYNYTNNHRTTSPLPTNGTFVKFEPTRNGILTLRFYGYAASNQTATSVLSNGTLTEQDIHKGDGNGIKTSVYKTVLKSDETYYCYLTYNSSYNNSIYGFTFEETPATVTAPAISSVEWSTYASLYPLDLSGIENGTAYYASAADESKVTLTSTTAKVSAGEGLMLKGEEGATPTIPIAAGFTTAAITGNKLKGCTANTTITNETANYASFYVLSVNGSTGKAEFQNLKNWLDGGNSVIIEAGKAYLDATGAGSRLSIVFDDDMTGISNVNGEAKANNHYYDLQGRPVSQPSKGLYIHNGRKVQVK